MNKKVKSGLLISSLVLILVAIGIGIAVTVKVYTKVDCETITTTDSNGDVVPVRDTFGFAVSDPSTHSIVTNPFDSDTVRETKIEKYGILDNKIGNIVIVEWDNDGKNLFFHVRVNCLVRSDEEQQSSSIEYRFSGYVKDSSISNDEPLVSITGNILPDDVIPTIHVGNLGSKFGISVVSVSNMFEYLCDIIVIFK